MPSAVRVEGVEAFQVEIPLPFFVTLAMLNACRPSLKFFDVGLGLTNSTLVDAFFGSVEISHVTSKPTKLTRRSGAA